ncbi:MAG: amidohydrolase family protein [bacterium]|nr:amidohydrolase family protein [bacterium]
MIIIDAQVHIWAADTPERPWPEYGKGYAQRGGEPFSKDDLLQEMDAAGVDRVVIVPPSWEGERNDLALEAAALHPDRFAIMGRLGIERPESRELIATWKEQPGMLGVRLTLTREHHRGWLSDGTADWFWAAAQRYDIPVMASVAGSIPMIAEIVARYPGLRLVIDHLGLPGSTRDAEFGAALEPLFLLAPFPNVAVKVSALPCYVTEAYPFRSLHPHIRRVVETFGPQRVFWGTDLTRLPCPYHQAVTLFSEALDFLSESDKEWIMGRAIAEWLNWPLAV